MPNKIVEITSSFAFTYRIWRVAQDGSHSQDPKLTQENNMAILELGFEN